MVGYPLLIKYVVISDSFLVHVISQLHQFREKINVGVSASQQEEVEAFLPIAGGGEG